MNMLAEEKEPENKMFNVKYLHAIKNKRSSFSTDQSSRNLKYGGADRKTATVSATSHVENCKDRERVSYYLQRAMS